MKPAPFEYYRPSSTAEALEKLAELGYGGKILAGGQSLIPSMSFRLARPAALVDLNNVAELFYIRPSGDGGFLIGTMTRTATVEHNADIASRYQAISQAMVHIAHPQIRNRGTFGGNIAHADPAGQLPGVSVALNARFHVRSKSGERWANADDFFLGPFATDMQPDEMLVEVLLPPLPPRSGTSYHQVSRQHGSQALVGVAALVTLDERNRCKAANLVMLCVGERAILARQASQLLIGKEPTSDAIRTAAATAAAKEIDPGSDIHATAEYRHSVAEVLAGRALNEAFERARGKGG